MKLNLYGIKTTLSGNAILAAKFAAEVAMVSLFVTAVVKIFTEE